MLAKQQFGNDLLYKKWANKDSATERRIRRSRHIYDFVRTRLAAGAPGHRYPAGAAGEDAAAADLDRQLKDTGLLGIDGQPVMHKEKPIQYVTALGEYLEKRRSEVPGADVRASGTSC